MSSSEALRVPSRLHLDLWLVRALVLVNGAVPLVLLGYDAWRSALGANPVSFALHTTGHLALVFFVLSLAVSPLQRLTGIRELVASRRALGLYGFFYLVVHFGIFFALDRAGSIRSTIHEILTRRYLQIGTVALVLFIPLAVTATDRMITRLGARRWKRLHRLTYLATSLGVLHYILLVKSDLRQPLAFAGVVSALLGFRVFASVKDRRVRAGKRPWSGELRVASVKEETHDVRTFRLVPTSGGKLPFTHRAGQYLNLRLLIDGARVNRSYTIASAPTTRDYCEITVKKADQGAASTHLHDVLREGAVVQVTAPAGRFVFEGEGTEDVLLIAGGVGITPLMAMIRTLTDRRWRGRIDLVYSVKTKDDLVFAAELEQRAARFEGLHVTLTFTRGQGGRIDKALLTRVAPRIRQIPIYLCGPDPMMAAMKALLDELGAPPENVHVEAFASPPRAPAGDAANEALAEAEESPARGSFAVQFEASAASTSTSGDETLLEAAEELGIDIPYDCRAGICGQCKTRLVRGRVSMAVQDALTADDRKHHLVLACQARPVSDVVVDG